METHLHLEGSIPRRILGRLARSAGRPPFPGGPSGPAQRGRGFAAFLDAFVACASLLRDARAFDLAASALFEDLTAEGVLYAEVAFSPQVHVRRGVPLAAVLAALGRARARARRAGLEVGYVADAGRLWGGAWFDEIVAQILEAPGCGVVAVGLGGEEAAASARAFRRAFDRARRGGLGTTAHAGEGTGPGAVRAVVEELGVRRVGHGIAAAEDGALLALLARRGVVLDVCLTSNVMTGAVASLRRHPLARLLESGVRVALGSDDRTLFGTTLRREYALAVREAGVPPGRVPELILNAVWGSFAPPALKRAIARRIRREVPAPGGTSWGASSRA